MTYNVFGGMLNLAQPTQSTQSNFVRVANNATVTLVEE